MKRKILAISLAIATAISFAGCKKSKKTEPAADPFSDPVPESWTKASGRVVSEDDPFFDVTEVQLQFPIDPEKTLRTLDIDRDNVRFMGNTIVVTFCHIAYEMPDDVKAKLKDYENQQDWEHYWAIQDEYEKNLNLVFDLDGKLLRSSAVEVSYEEVSSDELVLCTGENEAGETFAIVMRSEGYFLEKICDDGTMERIREVDPVSAEKMLVLPDGKILCANWDTISLLDENGKLRNSAFSEGCDANLIYQNGKCYGMFTTVDWDTLESSHYYQEIDLNTMTFVGEKIPSLRSAALNYAHGSLYYMNTYGVVKADLFDEKNDMEVFSWNSTDYDPAHILPTKLRISVTDKEFYFIKLDESMTGVPGDDRYIVNVVLVRAKRADKNPHAGKTMILAGCNVYSRIDLRDVIRYNTSEGAKCRVVLHDYSSDVVMDADYMNKNAAMSDKVYLDIMSGTGPDILVGFSQFAQFDTDQVMCDLNTFIDRTDGTGLDRSLLFDNILRAQEVGGKLYHMPVSFRVDGIVGNADLVGQKANWTYDEFFQVMDALPQGVDPFFTWQYSELLSFMMERSGDAFIDYASKEVHFDTKAFQDLLTFVKKYGIDKSYHEMVMDPNYVSEEEKFENGLLAWYPVQNLFGVREYAHYMKLIRNPEVFCGVPNSTGGSPSAKIEVSLGISAFTPYQEEAWDFIRFLLKTQEESEDIGLTPISRTALDKQNAACLKWYEDNILNGSSEMQGMTEEINEEVIGEFVRLVESIHVVERADPTVLLIILEEAPAFFTGQQSVETVCNTIQNRAKQVVQER